MSVWLLRFRIAYLRRPTHSCFVRRKKSDQPGRKIGAHIASHTSHHQSALTDHAHFRGRFAAPRPARQRAAGPIAGWLAPTRPHRLLPSFWPRTLSSAGRWVLPSTHVSVPAPTVPNPTTYGCSCTKRVPFRYRFDEKPPATVAATASRFSIVRILKPAATGL